MTLPSFANTGELIHHDLGCRCWPHVTEKDALDAVAAVGLAEYRSARLPTRHALAQALPEHRYCTDHIRGHESCLAAADTILRNLEGGK